LTRRKQIDIFNYNVSGTL